MRAKRSKDTRLVNKFNKQRQDLATERCLHQPASSYVTADDSALAAGNEEGDLKVRRILFYLFCRVLRWRKVANPHNWDAIKIKVDIGYKPLYIL